MALADLVGVGAFGAILAMGAVFVVFALAVYLYMAFALMKIAKKTKTENGWLAFIPIANIYLMTQIAGMPGWYTLAIFLPIIPILGGLAMAAVMVWIWWKIAEAVGKPGWWAILMLIPLVNFVVLGIMAWGK